MPVQPIPFAPMQATGDEALAGAVGVALNLLVDGAGALSRRPCVKATTALPSTAPEANSVNSIHQTNDGRILVSTRTHANVSNVYLGNSSSYLLLGELVGKGRPVWANTEAMSVATAGYQLTRLLLNTNNWSIIGESPVCSHVTANSSRLVTNNVSDNPGFLYYSAVSTGQATSGHEEWGVGIGTSGLVSVEARPDPVLALFENTNELFAFGRTNLQVFTPEAESIYVPVSTREYGCSAPYGVVSVDQSFAWIDHKRRIILSDGRSYEHISKPIQRELNEISDVSDCWGHRVEWGPMSCVVWHFPSDNRSFAYYDGIGWGQWSGDFQAVAQLDGGDGKILVGTSSGAVGELSMDATDDLGSSVQASATTGFLDFGTDAIKQPVSTYLTLRRGEHQSVGEPLGWLEWRDRPGQWNKVPLSLGKTGAIETVLQFRSLGGPFRRRQWRVSWEGPESWVLASARVDFDVMGV